MRDAHHTAVALVPPHNAHTEAGRHPALGGVARGGWRKEGKELAAVGLPAKQQYQTNMHAPLPPPAALLPTKTDPPPPLPTHS